MFEKMQKIELSMDELEIIESALHTQTQMLNIEVGAGGTEALARLNGVKRVLSTLAQHKPTQHTDGKADRSCGWMGMARLLS